MKQAKTMKLRSKLAAGACWLLAISCAPAAQESDVISALLTEATANKSGLDRYSATVPSYGSRYVTMKRVRYCGGFLCTNATTPSEFRYWEDHNVDRDKQRETYIASLNPGRTNIENIVFFSAGQQTLTSTGAFLSTTNVLTGQPEDYKNGCTGNCASAGRYLDGRSLVVYLMNQPRFATSKTLYVLVFDAQFNFEYSSGERQKMENAYFAYLTANVDATRVKRIVLGGSSRGGALSYRLAQRFRGDSRFSSKALVVEGFDATTKTGDELNATSTLFTNPLNSSWKGRYLNIAAEFPNRNLLALNQIASGQEAFALTGARGFVYTTYSSDFGWFRQKWVNIKHGDIGSDYNYRSETMEYAAEHIESKFTEFGL